MSEYYCPNCGADLEDQSGFDPDEGTWTCTNCGQTLYGDDIAETMVLFDGVVWHCDSCGAVLNKQPGFIDSCFTWHCTDCGYANRISEDDIYESEDDYQNSRNEYECPHCGSILNDQYSFDFESDTHTCICCDTNLLRDNDEYIIMYQCPHCDAILNNQWGFNENKYYKCRRCWKALRLDGNEYVEDEEDDENTIDIDGGGDCDDERYASKSGDGSSYQFQNNTNESICSKTKTSSTKKRSMGKWLPLLIIVICIDIVLNLITNHIGKYAVTPESAKKCIDQNYQIIMREFSDAGFSNIETIPVDDLKDGWIIKATSKVDTIQSISVSGDTDFKKNQEYRKTSPVTIYYHVYPLND